MCGWATDEPVVQPCSFLSLAAHYRTADKRLLMEFPASFNFVDIILFV